MKQFYKIIRTILVSLLSLAVGIPFLTYALLSIPSLQNTLKSQTEKALTDILGADVSIASLQVKPFSRITASHLAISPAPGDTALLITRLEAGISLYQLTAKQKISITDIEIFEPQIKIWRDSTQAPLNIAPIIARLKGDPSKPPKHFGMAITTMAIRDGNIYLRSGSDSLTVTALSTDINAPAIGSDSTRLAIKRLRFNESHGVEVTRLNGNILFAHNTIDINSLSLALPASSLSFAPTQLSPKAHRIGQIQLLHGSHISPADLPLPSWALQLPTIYINGSTTLFTDSLNVEALNISAPGIIDLQAMGNKSAITIHHLTAAASPQLLEAIPGIPTQAISAAPATVQLSACWNKSAQTTVNADISTAQGNATLQATLDGKTLTGTLATAALNLSPFLPQAHLDDIDLLADFSLSPSQGSLSAQIPSLRWKEIPINNIDLTADYNDCNYAASVIVSDSIAAMSAQAQATYDTDFFALTLRADIDSICSAPFLPNSKPLKARAKINAAFSGASPYLPTGSLTVDSLQVADLTSGRTLNEHHISLITDFLSPDNTITLQSASATAHATGQINLQHIPQSLRRAIAQAFPQLFTAPTAPAGPNNFTLAATLHEDSPLIRFIAPKTHPIYDVTINAALTDSLQAASLDIDAPYIRSGNKLITATLLQGRLNRHPMLTAHSTIPGKMGPTNLYLNSLGSDGRINGNLGWKIDAQHNYGGDISFSLRPLPSGGDLRINSSEIVLNDTTWTVSPGYIGLRQGPYIIGNLLIDGPGQQIAVKGVASPDSADVLHVSLDNIDLDYLFDTLNLGSSLIFGGTATGNVNGRALLSHNPILQTDNLHVKNLTYQHALFGDGDIRAGWDNDNKAITIDADISGNDGRHATVDGNISLAANTLIFDFDAQSIPASFIGSFLTSWAEEVGGRASGHARLFGSLKNVDLEGDVFADDFSLKIGFTGATYHCTDSVHLRPGLLKLDRVRITDGLGHQATLSGRLDHNCFHDARFRFDVTDADALLVLDKQPDEQTQWGGRVFGNGSASISGTPGQIEINADMQTAQGSDFTFELRNGSEAASYDFLTFRSIDEMQRSQHPSALTPGSPELDREMARRIAVRTTEETPTDVNLKFRIDATPQVRLTLVMDPVTGDKITGYGSGHIDVNYETGNDELRMYGNYDITRGDYNFTLQDIIIKNFTLRPGSNVAFHGDPMNATLDVSAAYQLNASLTDLDESFLTDKEVQRTNVPVQAVLNLGGKLQNPEISFDIDLPTLTDDVKRKVRSIVSTDDMMNRQIIYLLALNRFYTPDYMAGSRSGNDLTSFASGTISSQLSNILGQLSDKISIAPSLRSEAGDFSDLEFDVALSSTLLNNRLLLNGNFGYRDKTLNNNQFIGDFDVEYLLTRKGNWRLKAYNHFNDRNLYTRNALTTQGLGIMFKHDFDSLRRKNR